MKKMMKEDSSSDSSSSSLSGSRVYVVVSGDLSQDKENFLWSLKNFQGQGHKIVILHVHQPAQMVPAPLGGKMPCSKFNPEELKAFRQLERQEKTQKINQYLLTCKHFKMQAEVLIVEGADAGKSIVDAVSEHQIDKLVVSTTADKWSSRRTSKIALYVNRYAICSCQIWFVYKGKLVFNREAFTTEPGQWSLPAWHDSSTSLQSRSVASSETDGTDYREKPPFWRQAQPLNATNISPEDNGNYGKDADFTPRSSSVSSSRSSFSSSTEASRYPENYTDYQHSLHGLSYSEPVVETETVIYPSFSSSQSPLKENNVDVDELIDKLKKARDEAFQESQKRRKAEQEALEAVNKVRQAENALTKEQLQRKEVEAELSVERAKLEAALDQLLKLKADLKIMSSEKSLYEARLNSSVYGTNETVENLNISLAKLEMEKLEIMRERDEAVTRLQEFLQGNNSSSNTSSKEMLRFTEFSLSELAEATNGFDNGCKIGEGGFGPVYKGTIRFTSVAIKILNAEGTQGSSEFQQEVSILSRLRHPHLVTLIGTCREERAVVYEYLPNGSLEDRLQRKNGTQPLPWHVRTRIASEICSGLLFLHSSNIVHGDLKPGNILLDANFSVRISDFGICKLLPDYSTTMTLCIKTDPKGTFSYMDPEFLATGEMTPKVDVYSFGVIILQLLTAKPSLWITKEVQRAMNAGNLDAIVDSSGGDWPSDLALQLAQLGIKCCEISRRLRPDLGSEVRKILEQLVVTYASSRTSQ